MENKTDKISPLYVARLSLKIAKDGLNNGPPKEVKCSALEWAIYNIAAALEDICRHLEGDLG